MLNRKHAHKKPRNKWLAAKQGSRPCRIYNTQPGVECTAAINDTTQSYKNSVQIMQNNKKGVNTNNKVTSKRRNQYTMKRCV